MALLFDGFRPQPPGLGYRVQKRGKFPTARVGVFGGLGLKLGAVN